MDDETRLKEKLRAVGRRVRSGGTSTVQAERSVEWRFSLDPWTRRLFIALSRRYAVEPYRYHGQRHATLVICAPEQCIEEVVIPEYEKLSEVLHAHLHAVTARVVTEVLDADASEPRTVEQRQLEAPATWRK